MPAHLLDRDEVHGGYIDLDKHELRNAVLQNLGADPGTPLEGQFYWRSDTNKWRVFDGATWQDIATMADVTAGGISAAIFDAKGDLITATAGDTPVREPVGADGTFYVAASGQATGHQWRIIAETDIPAAIARDAEAQGYADAAQAFAIQRANHTGAQAISTVTGLQTALDAKVDDSQIGANNGVASLDAGGKVPSAQLPALALTDVNVVADITARDALVVEEGDVAIVTDAGGGQPATFIYDGAAWQELEGPVDGVSAVTGAAPITSTGGTTPEIGLALLGVLTGHLADQAVTAAKIDDAAIGAGLTGGAGTPIALDTAIAVRKASGDLTGGANSETKTHNLGTRRVDAFLIRNVSPWDRVDVYYECPSVNTVTFYAATGNNLSTDFDWVVMG